MKKFLTLTIIALVALIAMTVNVQAAEVTTLDKLKTELAEGTDELVTLKGSLNVTTTETLDLNGKSLTLEDSLVIGNGASLTVTGNGSITSDVASDLIVVKQGGTLVVENGALMATANDNGVVRVEGNSTDTTERTTVTIKKDARLVGNYCIYIPRPAVKDGNNYGVVINVYGTLEGITGNNGYESGSIAISTNGYNTAIDGSVPMINIYDGALLTAAEGTLNRGEGYEGKDLNENDAPVIYAAGYANWNIYGGTLKGSEALSIKAGKFNITGGTFEGNGKYVNPANANGDGSEATGSAISITANSGYVQNVKLYITNANVSSQNGYAISESTTKGTGTAIAAISISGGNFVGNEEVGTVLISNATEVGKFITGGTFSSDVKEYTEGDSVKDEVTGEYIVGTLNAIKVAEAENGKVEVSLSQAVAGQTVTVTATPDKDYKLAELKAYDADGKEITIVDGKFVMVDDEVTIKAVFEKVVEPDQDEDEEDVKDEDKEDVKDEDKEDVKDEDKEDVKDEDKEDIKDEDKENIKDEDKEDIKDEDKEDAKDVTPTTGAANVISYAWIALIVIVMIVALKNKKVARHSK